MVGVVGAAGGHDGVAAHRLDVLGGDLRVGIGQGEDDGLRGHLAHHVGLEHAAGRQAQEHIGPFNHLAQMPSRGLLRELHLVFVHQLGAAFIHHAGQVGDKHVLAPDAQMQQQVQTGQCGRAGPGGHQLDLTGLLAGDLQGIDHGRADRDGRAVLIIVKDRDLQPLAQFTLDVKAVGRLDVFEVDGAKGRLQGCDHLDQPDRVLLVDFNVKHVDTGELLEQDRLALHHRLGGQGADVAQTEHRRAVGDHRHQIAAAGVLEGVVRVFDDFFAGRSHAWRVGQGQVALIGQLLGGGDGQLARRRQFVIEQCRTAQALALVVLGVGRMGGHGYSWAIIVCRVMRLSCA